MKDEFTKPVTPGIETEKAKTAARRFRPRIFASLRHADYRYLWTGTLMMSTGQWVQQVTLGWLLYDLTGNSMLLGALNGLRALPFLVTGPMAGVAADRMDRRKLLLYTQWVLIITAILMGALVASPFLHVWHIFLFTLITGVAWTITEPVRMSMIPSVVPKPRSGQRDRAQLRRLQFDESHRSRARRRHDRLVRSGGQFLRPRHCLHRRAGDDLPDAHPAPPRRSEARDRLRQSQGRRCLRLVHAGRASADDARICASGFRGTVPNIDARVSERRAACRTRRIGSINGGARHRRGDRRSDAGVTRPSHQTPRPVAGRQHRHPRLFSDSSFLN